MTAKPRSTNRAGLIKAVQTPLGFYVLSLLIIEATLALVLSQAKLEPAQRYTGFLWMIGIFIGLVVVVTAFAFWKPTHLLYGKDEHLARVDPAALKDQIEDIIAQKVKPECLKKDL